MKFYVSIINVGTIKIPILILEYIFKEDENYHGMIVPFYKNIIQNLTFDVIKDYLILLKDKVPFLKFKLKNKLSIENLLLEVQIHVIDYAYQAIEQGFLKTILYKDKKCDEIIEGTKPSFNIKDEKGYLNFYKKGVELCKT